jgi:GDP-4-dehydro-6-deoxy-D-mannose reductase
MLLLGASGFLGSHLAPRAEGAGLRVLAASRSGEGADLACDLLDPGSIGAALREAEPDLVVNLAGSASVRQSWSAPGAGFAVNALGVVNLLDAIVGQAPGAHLLCASSAEVYGEPAPGRLPFREDQALEPVTPYGAAKAAMETACAQYARARGLRIALMRIFNVLGPGQAPEFAASGFARTVAEAEARGEGAELAVGNIGAARDFVDVGDAAEALATVCERELTGTFNLCSGRAVPLAEVVEALRASAKVTVRTRSAPELARPADPTTSYGSPERLRDAAGWEARTPLGSTLADLLGWWREQLSGEAQAPQP